MMIPGWLFAGGRGRAPPPPPPPPRRAAPSRIFKFSGGLTGRVEIIPSIRFRPGSESRVGFSEKFWPSAAYGQSARQALAGGIEVGPGPGPAGVARCLLEPGLAAGAAGGRARRPGAPGIGSSQPPMLLAGFRSCLSQYARAESGRGSRAGGAGPAASADSETSLAERAAASSSREERRGATGEAIGCQSSGDCRWHGSDGLHLPGITSQRCCISRSPGQVRPLRWKIYLFSCAWFDNIN